MFNGGWGKSNFFFILFSRRSFRVEKKNTSPSVILFPICHEPELSVRFIYNILYTSVVLGPKGNFQHFLFPYAAVYLCPVRVLLILIMNLYRKCRFFFFFNQHGNRINCSARSKNKSGKIDNVLNFLFSSFK